MAVEPIQPVEITGNALDHQARADRFYSLWKGAEEYVTKWLPEHPNKEVILTGLKQLWDNTIGVLKDDLVQVQTAATQDAKADVQTVEKQAVTDVEPVAESAATEVAQAVEETATDVQDALPDTSSNLTTADAVTTGTETPAPETPAAPTE